MPTAAYIYKPPSVKWDKICPRNIDFKATLRKRENKCKICSKTKQKSKPHADVADCLYV